MATKIRPHVGKPRRVCDSESVTMWLKQTTIACKNQGMPSGCRSPALVGPHSFCIAWPFQRVRFLVLQYRRGSSHIRPRSNTPSMQNSARCSRDALRILSMKDKVASNVICTAGNLVDDYALASIEYAVDRIGAGHLMFMIEPKKAAAVLIA
jgi:hypothetical protein